MRPDQTTNRSSRLILAVFLLIFLGQASLWAARKGARLKVQRSNQPPVVGELIAVRESKLILLDAGSQDLTIDINEVDLIIIDKKPHPWLGAALGMVLGGVAGVAAAPAGKVEQPGDLFGGAVIETGTNAAAYGLAGFLIGGVLGGVVGAALGSDSQVVVAKMSPAEREQLIIRLRSKARVKTAN